MNKHFLGLILGFSLFSFSLFALPVDDEVIPRESDELAIEREVPPMELNAVELRMITDNPNQQYVYVSQDASESLNAIPVYPNMPDELRDLKEHLNLKCRTAPYELTLNAVSQALNYYKAHWKPEYRKYWKALQNYQRELEEDEARIVMEQVPTRSRGCKSFCSLFVRDCLKVGSLAVCGNSCFRQNVNIGGNLEVANDVNVGGDLSAAECLSVARDICAQGNVVFNALGCSDPINFSSGALFAQGARECFLKTVRGTVVLSNATINTGADTVSATVTPVSGANVGYVTTNLSGTAADTAVTASFGGQPARLIDATFQVTLTDHPSTSTQLTTALSLELLNNQALTLTAMANNATVVSLQVISSPSGTNTFTVRVIILAIGTNDATIVSLLTSILNNLRIHFIVEDRVVTAQCSNTLNCNLSSANG